MVTNLNKTKNSPQKKTFETSCKTRGTTQITENFPSLSELKQALCLYAALRKESTKHCLSVLRLRSDKSLEKFTVVSHQPTTLCAASNSDRLHHSRFLRYSNSLRILTLQNAFVNTFFKKTKKQHPFGCRFRCGGDREI